MPFRIASVPHNSTSTPLEQAMTFTITPAQFAALKKSLALQHGVAVTVSPDGNSGTVSNSDLKLSYALSGSTLTVSVVQKFSFKAKIAPQSAIEARVAELINPFITPAAATTA
jgi:hypothetical protein